MANPTTGSNVIRSIAQTSQYIQEKWSRDIQQPFDKGRLGLLVPAAEDGHFPAFLGQLAGKHLHHRRLAGPTHRQVAHADHLASQGVVPQNAVRIQEQAKLDQRAVNAR